MIDSLQLGKGLVSIPTPTDTLLDWKSKMVMMPKYLAADVNYYVSVVCCGGFWQWLLELDIG
jgi:hypothetical protein